MLTTLLIIARTAQIAASILLVGTFTFDLLTLGPAARPATDDLREVEQSLFRLTIWSLVASLLSALLWFWLEVASMSGLPFVNAFSTTARTDFGSLVP
jgi:hypothetical protein